MPVAIAVALVRVTVGNTAWPFAKFTPSWRSRHRLGVSSAVIESGRSPSSTITTLSVAFPADATVAIATAPTSTAKAVMIRKDIRRYMSPSVARPLRRTNGNGALPRVSRGKQKTVSAQEVPSPGPSYSPNTNSMVMLR